MRFEQFRSPYWVGVGFSLDRSTETKGWVAGISLGRWTFEWWSK